MKFEKLPGSRISFEVPLTDDMLKKATQSVLASYQAKVSIPGFRVGKAPLAMVQQRVGLLTIHQDAMEKACGQAYMDTIQSEKLHPVAPPEVKLGDEEKPPVTATYTVEVFPEIPKIAYKSLLPKSIPAVTVTDKEVQEVVTEMCIRANTGMVEAKKAKKGNLVKLTYTGVLDEDPEKPFTQSDEHTFELGAGRYLPDLEKGIADMKAGETKEVSVTFPDEYHAESLQGKKATFTVNVIEVMVSTIKKLDDDLVQKLGSKEKTKDEFIENLKSQIEKKKSMDKKNELIQKFEQGISNKFKGDVPASWVNREVQHRMNNVMQHPLYTQDQDAFWNAMGVDQETYMENLKTEAEKTLRGHVAWMSITGLTDTEASQVPEKRMAFLQEHFAV